MRGREGGRKGKRERVEEREREREREREVERTGTNGFSYNSDKRTTESYQSSLPVYTRN